MNVSLIFGWLVAIAIVLGVGLAFRRYLKLSIAGVIVLMLAELAIQHPHL